MASVTKRIAEIIQPRGGYLKPSEFDREELFDGRELGTENISPNIVGMAVDYLSRFMLDRKNNPYVSLETSVTKAFAISLSAYYRREQLVDSAVLKEDKKNGVEIGQLLSRITGLNAESIIAACKATTYDVWRRNPMSALESVGPLDINPDIQTINNIKIMVERSILFFEKYGPILADGFTFEKDGYTDVVDSGDGDFLTKDTLWDFKVSKNNITNKNTLQLLMYWIMGKHSKQLIFKYITQIGIYNPRLNTVFSYDLSNCPKQTIKDIEDKVICYK